MLDQSTVTYKNVPDLPGYRAGDDGSIWSCFVRVGTRVTGGSHCEISDTWKRLKGFPSKQGHLRLSIGGANYCVHRLVALAFFGPCPDGREVCHKDGNPVNNVVSNLYYGTKLDNAADAIRHGVQVRGERHPMAKLTESQVREIVRAYADGVSQKEIAPRFGISHSTVNLIVNKKIWKHVA